jgi:hypothetical protein
MHALPRSWDFCYKNTTISLNSFCHHAFAYKIQTEDKDVEKRQTNVANKLACKTNQISFNNL